MAGPYQEGNHKATKNKCITVCITVHACLDSKHNIVSNLFLKYEIMDCAQFFTQGITLF